MVLLTDPTDGQIVQFSAATGAFSPVNPTEAVPPVLAYVNASVTSGDTVDNTASETAFDKTHTIAAGELLSGTVVRVRAAGCYSTTASNGTLTFKLKFGSTAIVTTPAILSLKNAANVGWDLEATIVCWTTGASGTVDAQAVCRTMLTTSAANVTMVPGTSTVTIDTTASQVVSATITMGVAATGNTVKLRQLIVEVLNQ